MPRYKFVADVETVLHGLAHDVNAILHRIGHGQPAGSTLVAKAGDEITTAEEYVHAHMVEIEDTAKGDFAKARKDAAAVEAAAKKDAVEIEAKAETEIAALRKKAAEVGADIKGLRSKIDIAEAIAKTVAANLDTGTTPPDAPPDPAAPPTPAAPPADPATPAAAPTTPTSGQE